MPIRIPRHLPAAQILEKENIFVMDDERAITQDIRPLNIVILNLMPEKQKTEAHLLRLLGNSPLQVNITFLKTATYEAKNVSASHMREFYTEFAHIHHKRFDGMIITGAPIEHLDFENVHYWEEIIDIMDWAEKHVTSIMHICWGAQAALYHHYGITKFPLQEKCSGIFHHRIYHGENPIKLLRGFDDEFIAPHSRYTNISEEELIQHPELKLVASSQEAGPFLIMSQDGKHIMATGHLEYDTDTLKEEYERDLNRGLSAHLPVHYFPNNDPNEKPLNRWRSHAHLLFSNWLNYYVYQETPYIWE
ncbi:homoserine O-succinyltransferase [Salipaludibacillus agaradhaerens]|uniref:homoserine O-acetyltransferase MetA n=1 Tax=Salipaludibacillus agaradhaerens TaxID=76935 RepID=UPI0009980895|nr:homoserine O-succinyltransferase [Salipaludibacillus agaradhaerens]MCR6108347.1 homoserine O-succinyltransferase [Salipaludibacillus agaradhaerens]MCR6120371.1 homoserine O-succinyltransferase [Salipaludibacillus agaradhaerens]UJW59380.1 homoserine O-succinyltransferase [Bacillus sp. A116_S68]